MLVTVLLIMEVLGQCLILKHISATFNDAEIISQWSGYVWYCGLFPTLSNLLSH